MTKPLIESVSDTALWVATFRAKESLRKDALFKDPFAAKLAGEKGVAIAAHSRMSRFTEWVVVTRTVVIDRMIEEMIADGVDLIVNLGTGLDTRPYRMKLPPTLRWIEVDFPRIIDHKEKILKDEIPHCILERMRVDLSDSEASKKCFAEIAAKAKKILILTEGVIPYLTNEQVAELAKNLHAHPQFHYWITEYLSPQAIKRLHGSERRKQMQNAPFQFAPDRWMEFFKNLGWREKETKYLAIESKAMNRPIPLPRLVKILIFFMPKKRRADSGRFTGFTIYERIG